MRGAGGRWRRECVLSSAILICLVSTISAQTVEPSIMPQTTPPTIYNGTYVVLAPSVMRAGLPYAVWLSIRRGGGDNIIRISILDKDNQTIAQAFKKNVLAGQQETVSVDIPTGLSPEERYSLYVKGEDLGSRTLFEASADIRLNPKAQSLFIQTDKAIYKPGATVNFRVVAVDPNLLPLNSTIDVKLFDPQNNVILQALSRRLEKGIWGRSLELSAEPPVGDWRIVVTLPSGFKTTKSFTVEKYVLPKFEVKVEPPSFVTIKDDIVVQVSAKYTYGKGVEGRAKVRAEYPWRYYGEDDYQPISQSIRLDSNGEGTVRFTNAMLVKRKLVNEWGYNRVKFVATVEEELTGIARNATADVMAYKQAAKIKIKKPGDNFKPGLPFEVVVAVVQQDDTPIPASFGKTALLRLEYTFPYKPEPENEKSPIFDERELALEADGTKRVRLDPPKGIDNIRIEVIYEKGGNFTDTEIMQTEHIYAAKSPSSNYLMITPNQAKVGIDETLSFKIVSTASVAKFTWIVMSRGKVETGGELEATDGEATLRFQARPAMAPKSRLLVYAVHSDRNEIIVDALDFSLDGLFRNKVSVSMSKPRAEPGESVEVVVQASAESTVCLLAVDQSVLLLKSGNDITAEMVEADVEGYDTSGFGGGGWPGPWGPRGPMIVDDFGRRRKRSIWFPWIGGKDAATVFQNAGLKVLTDALLYREPMRYGAREASMGQPVYLAAPARVAEGDALDEAAMMLANGQEETATKFGLARQPSAPRLRTAFPETWLWTAASTGANGEVRYETEVPDTITSWITSAFAINDIDGLGVAPEPSKLEVFRPFFIRLNLPYSVKRGENVALQVLIFNYMPEKQWVTVTLAHDANSGFDFVEKDGALVKGEKPTKAYNQRRIQVGGGGGSTSLFFPIVPSKIGELRLSLTATASSAGDAIQQSLLVEPEGFRVDQNKPIIMDLTETSEFSTSFTPTYPDDVVEGSERVRFTLIGDIMGPVLSTAENLVRMPYGCGEQNMLNFVPNIVVVRYLRATQRLSETLEAKALRYMEAGYQRELTYKRSDNSFSAFGDSDNSGSTWLTAFVVRSFKQASRYIYVDEKVLQESIAFLRSQQMENGQFAERGEVHHKAMQGGSGQGGVPLTAYVLIALLENDISNPEALNYIETNMDTEKDSAYSMAIITYALQLAGSAKKDEAFQILQSLSTTEGTQTHWSDTVGEDGKEKPSYWSGPRPVDVEASAYALLSLMLKSDTAGGLPVVRWLTSNRNALGGYSSTQDTVMALQALGAYAEAAYSPNFDVSVELDNGGERQTFSVTPDNAILLQSTDLKSVEEATSISATGSGMAFGQISWSYHLVQDNSDAPFQCDKEIRSKSENDVLLSLCCKYKGGKSNMAVLEVDSLSGFEMDAEAINGLTTLKDLQRVELTNQDTRANIYLSSLGINPLCLNITSQRVFGVSKQKPAAARLYDYYEPSARVELQYTAEREVSLQSACPSCWDNVPAAASSGRWSIGVVSLLLALLPRLFQ